VWRSTRDKMEGCRGRTVCILLPVLLVILPSAALSRVRGQCVNCHTMHNSQDRQPMTESGQLNQALLLNDCVGCHTGTNSGSNDTPYVFHSSPPQYGQTGTEATSNTLAGGNFYWVATTGGDIGDRQGHNVQGISPPDAKLALPPGNDGTFNGQLTCAGTLGCHGLRTTTLEITDMKGSHHNKDHSIWQDGTTLPGSYRFLNTIQGFGDQKYEYRPTSNQHNKYFGLDRSVESDQAPGTISSLCAECHQDYHNGAGSVGTSMGTGVWLRHPTDFDMSGAVSSGEYAGYNGGSGNNNIYSVISPVATNDTSPTVNQMIYSGPNDAVVMCLSCHRAHGTPHRSMLRWDYKGWPAGGYNGCAVCHTAKN
jgi:doubled CXXCH motif protein